MDASHMATLHALVLRRSLLAARRTTPLDPEYNRWTIFYFPVFAGVFAPGTHSQHFDRPYGSYGDSTHAVQHRRCRLPHLHRCGWGFQLQAALGARTTRSRDFHPPFLGGTFAL